MAKKLFSNLEIPIGEDIYSFDGLTKADLTELDLTKFPTQDQLNTFNTHLNTEQYVKKADLTELDLTKFPTQDELNTFNTHLNTEQYVKKADLTVLNLQDIINRIETIEQKLNITRQSLIRKDKDDRLF